VVLHRVSPLFAKNEVVLGGSIGGWQNTGSYDERYGYDDDKGGLPSMKNNQLKKVRTYQHPGLADLVFDLEIDQDTLEFRIQIQGQVFTGKDGNEVLKQAGDYLRNLPVPGNWQPMIELVHYNRRMEAIRRYVCHGKNGAIVQHPWVQALGEIEVPRITELRYHSSVFDPSHQGVPPCAHHDGLSSYYHLPYSPGVWERVQVLTRTCNEFNATLGAFLDTVSTPVPHEEWEAHFLEHWLRLSFFDVDLNRTEQ
jgi:hypothetical protein